MKLQRKFNLKKAKKKHMEHKIIIKIQIKQNYKD